MKNIEKSKLNSANLIAFGGGAGYSSPPGCSNYVSPGQYSSLSGGFAAVAGIAGTVAGVTTTAPAIFVPAFSVAVVSTGFSAYNNYCANWNSSTVNFTTH